MFRPVAVQARPGYKLWLRYSDGIEGEADLSEFAGRGVFKAWEDYRVFEKVHIGDHGQIAWDDDIDMCADALYLRVTGRTPEDVFPNLREMSVNA